MSGQYTKAEVLSEEVFRRKAAGETNREIGARFGLSKEQVKGLVSRQSRKPYRHCQQAVHKYPNLLQRAFAQPFPAAFG